MRSRYQKPDQIATYDRPEDHGVATFDQTVDPQAVTASQRLAELVRIRQPLIYCAIQPNQIVKIGFTTDLAPRLRKLHVDLTQVLVLVPGDRDRETEILRELRPSVAHGREWFRWTDQVKCWVNEQRAVMGLDPIDQLPAKIRRRRNPTRRRHTRVDTGKRSLP